MTCKNLLHLLPEVHLCELVEPALIVEKKKDCKGTCHSYFCYLLD